MSSSNQEEYSDSFIPASQRPDGTWRKARRVKEGYVPQEEVPLYESKGKKFLNIQQQPSNPIKMDGYTSHKTIPGLFIETKASKSQKKKASKEIVDTIQAKVDQTTKDLKKLQVVNDNCKKTSVIAEPAPADPTKKLKNLKKRLREVEALEQKIKNGELAKPEPEQLVKVGRKMELVLQIQELE